MTLLPHQAFVALKRELAARGKRAPPELSIVDGFCRQPSPVSGADSVGPAACLLVRAAARASPAALREDAPSMIRGAPPLQMGQQVGGRLRRRPGATSQ